MKYFYFLLVFVGMHTNAQTSTEAIQKEINQTVWKPFKSAFERLDAKALNETYAANVLRVTPQGIDTQNTFKEGNRKRFSTLKEKGNRISLDFWFEDRKTNETTSYEVGFYRIGLTTSGKIKYNYGQFHIVLRKIHGKWKITQDWDTTTIAGKSINSIDFEKKETLKF